MNQASELVTTLQWMFSGSAPLSTPMIVAIIALSFGMRWVTNVLADYIPKSLIFEWQSEIAEGRESAESPAAPSLWSSIKESPIHPHLSVWLTAENNRFNWAHFLADIISLTGPLACFAINDAIDLMSVSLATLMWVSACAIIIDSQHMLLPDALTIPSTWAGLLVNALGGFISIEDAVIGAVSAYLFLAIFATSFKWLTKKDGIGLGDAKWMAVAGAWFGAGDAMITLLISTVIGATIGLVFRKQEFPFGPMLCSATIAIGLIHVIN